MSTMEERILAAITQRQDEFKANLECATACTPPSIVHPSSPVQCSAVAHIKGCRVL